MEKVKFGMRAQARYIPPEAGDTTAVTDIEEVMRTWVDYLRRGGHAGPIVRARSYGAIPDVSPVEWRPPSWRSLSRLQEAGIELVYQTVST